jgi:hypothetical protein
MSLSIAGRRGVSRSARCDRESFLAGSAEHLVRLEEEGWWNGQAERLGGLEVDDQFEPGGLLHGEVGPFTWLPRESGCTPKVWADPEFLAVGDSELDKKKKASGKVPWDFYVPFVEAW